MKENENDHVDSEIQSGPYSALKEEMCVCLDCGTQVPPQVGKPCTQTKCPQCGQMMVLKE